MSRQTPRKPRHQQQPSEGGGGGGSCGVSGHRGQQSQQHAQQQQYHQQSDFDSSGLISEDPRLRRVHAPTESLDDMNLHVLQRYEPTIRTIEAVAASSVAYVFSGETGGWLKAEPQIEGTLFLCEQEPLAVDPYVLPRACVFVLNRKGLMNVVVDLARVSAAEVTDGLITLSIEDEAATAGDGADGTGTPQVLGLWIHGNSTEGNGPGIAGMQFDPNVVVRRWQAMQASLEESLGTARLSDTAGFLDAAAVMAKMNLTVRGLNPDGIATAAIGPQPGIKEVVTMVLGQAGGHGGA